MVCKKYLETVGDTAAAQKPIGTGPWKLVESKLASYYKLEALDSHWRVVPEFKSLTVRLIPEVSSIVAALKNKEIDLASIPAEQMANLKLAGLAAEAASVGGSTICIAWGGCAIPEDSRYDAAIHNKDPWADVKVRKAMTLAIDRQAICNTIFAGAAFPAAIPLISANMDKYQYPYDPAAAKQLLADAGYPKGFSFKVISYTLNGVPETPRVIEALAGYWQQIGLDPQITVSDYASYSQNHRNTLQNTGEVSVNKISALADMMDRSLMYFGPGGMVFCFQDEGSYAIIQEGNAKVSPDERQTYVDKLNQYFYENYYGSVITMSLCWAWNPAKVAPFPHNPGATPYYLEYVRHAQPINTFRLFTPWPER
jgi:peptide/nickel transport system substrate-binding protein